MRIVMSGFEQSRRGNLHPRRQTRSKRLQVLHQVGLFLGCELQRALLVVVVHYVIERLGAAVVEVRWMLPEATQRRGAVRAVLGALGVRPIHARLARLMQLAGVVVGAVAADVAARAG